MILQAQFFSSLMSAAHSTSSLSSTDRPAPVVATLPSHTSSVAYLGAGFELLHRINANNLKFVDTSSLTSTYETDRIHLRQLFHAGAILHQDHSKLNIEERDAWLLCGTYYALCHNYSIGGRRDTNEIQSFLNRSASVDEPLALALRSENYWFGECGYKQDEEAAEKDAVKSYQLLYVPLPQLRQQQYSYLLQPVQSHKWPKLYQRYSFIGATVWTWCLRKKQMTNKVEGIEQLIDDILAQVLSSLESESNEGDSISIDWYAWRFVNGETVKQDKVRGFELFKQSALYGLSWAQLWTGNRLRDGEGVEKDLIQAMKFMQKAIDQGNEEASMELKKLKGDINTE